MNTGTLALLWIGAWLAIALFAPSPAAD